MGNEKDSEKKLIDLAQKIVQLDERYDFSKNNQAPSENPSKYEEIKGLIAEFCEGSFSQEKLTHTISRVIEEMKDEVIQILKEQAGLESLEHEAHDHIVAIRKGLEQIP